MANPAVDAFLGEPKQIAKQAGPAPTSQAFASPNQRFDVSGMSQAFVDRGFSPEFVGGLKDLSARAISDALAGFGVRGFAPEDFPNYVPPPVYAASPMGGFNDFGFGEPRQQFGLPVGQGAPGGDAIAWLQSLGMPIPPFLQALQHGQALPQTDYGNVLQQFGNLSWPSLQGLQRIGPDATQFLAGLIETVFGIPFDRVVELASAPYAGLRQPMPTRIGY